MKYYSCGYKDTNEDFRDIHDFLKEVYALTGKPQTWEFVRLEFWRIGEPLYSSDSNLLCNNARLWRDDFGKLRGLFISEKGDECFNVLVHPDNEDLAEEIIDYAKNVWGKEKSKLETDGCVHSNVAKALLKKGFKQGELICNSRKYNLKDREFRIELPEGYSIKDIIEAPNYANKLDAIQKTYRPNGPVHDADANYWRTDLPSYEKELDLSVISSEGQHIAFCYGFIDKENKMAIIETVGTRPEYQKRGLGKAVITECFKRLKEKGVESAYIVGFSKAANALYQSLGPVEIHPFSGYTFERE